MTPGTCRSVLTVMAPAGWIVASVLGVLCCFLAGGAQPHAVPWQILAALVLGLLLATLPVSVALLAAYRVFRGTGKPDKPDDADCLEEGPSWRWGAFATLCGLEALVFPLTVVAAAAEDDSLVVSVPLNLALTIAAALVACVPTHWNRAAIAICSLHMIGIALATFAAAIEIETVVVSGLLLLVSSTLLVSLGPPPRTIRLLFGMSTALFILASFFVIAVGNVSQREAEAPLFAAIVAYQVLFSPLGFWWLHHQFQQRNVTGRAQFGLKQMLLLMGIVGLASAFARLAYTTDMEVRVAVALLLGGILIAGTVVAITMRVWPEWSGSSQLYRDPEKA